MEHCPRSLGAAGKTPAKNKESASGQSLNACLLSLDEFGLEHCASLRANWDLLAQTAGGGI